jgi:hypothetical protein
MHMNMYVVFQNLNILNFYVFFGRPVFWSSFFPVLV